MGALARAWARTRAAMRGHPGAPARPCNHCYGGSGVGRIEDAPTCMPCVLRFTRMVAERMDREAARVP